jgi:hypothetical protein
VTEPISFFGAQRFPDVVVHREMLESGRVRRTPLAVLSHFAIKRRERHSGQKCAFLYGTERKKVDALPRLKRVGFGGDVLSLFPLPIVADIGDFLVDARDIHSCAFPGL